MLDVNGLVKCEPDVHTGVMAGKVVLDVNKGAEAADELKN